MEFDHGELLFRLFRFLNQKLEVEKVKVWIATWDVGSEGSGVEVFASQSLALDAAVAYANTMSLLGEDTLTEAEARAKLAEEGSIAFEAEGCYYGVEEHEVQGSGA